MNAKITAILPVFNEEKTVNLVIRSLLKIKFIDKLIVIDDGSTDKSKQLINISKSNQLVKIFNESNLGKGYSVALALEKVETEFVLLLDSDILGYSNTNISNLVTPVIAGNYDYSLGTTNRKTLNEPSWKGSKLIGQRCYKTSDLKRFKKEMMKSSRYGLEILLNTKLKDKRSKLVYLEGTHHLTKFEKMSLPEALKSYLLEFLSLVKQRFN